MKGWTLDTSKKHRHRCRCRCRSLPRLRSYRLDHQSLIKDKKRLLSSLFKYPPAAAGHAGGVSKYISPFLTRSTRRVSVKEPSTCGTDNAAIARRRRSLSLVAVDYQSLLTKNVTMGRTAPYHSVWDKSFRQVHTENSWKPGASDSRALIMTSGGAGQRREQNRQNNAVFTIAAVVTAVTRRGRTVAARKLGFLSSFKPGADVGL
jgi:hypothetical protein